MSVTMNVIRDEGKRIPVELARTLYGEIGVAIEKYFEHLTYMEHFGVALCQFNLRPSDSANARCLNESATPVRLEIA